MNFKKTLVVLGIIGAVLFIAVVGIALWALNQKQQNANKTQAARENRWKGNGQPPIDGKDHIVDEQKIDTTVTNDGTTASSN